MILVIIFSSDCSNFKGDGGAINTNGNDMIHILVFILNKLLSKCSVGLLFVR